MTVEHLRRLLNVRPFEPFIIHLADQRQFRIGHPEAAIFWKSGRTIIVMNDDDLPEVIDLLFVISLRPLPPTETSNDFGR